MNQESAKAPNDNDWQAIDIYLFSNGQQHSPPRKYHLKAEDLNWWDSTLNYLARSHYGSLHKGIELYSLKGTKVEGGPLELQDGMTYVAVVPPDEFIDSGYEKYLIKASRSWEKRQAKRDSTVNNKLITDKRQGDSELIAEEGEKITFEAQNDSDFNKIALKVSENTSQILLDNVSTELTTIKMSHDNTTLVKPRKITSKFNKSDVQRPRKSIISSTPRSDKKRLSTQHTAFMKTPKLVEHSRNNSNFKTKENLYKKTFTKRPANVNVPVNNVSLKIQRITKPSCKSIPLDMKITPRLQSTTLLETPSPLSSVPSLCNENTRLLNIENHLLTEKSYNIARIDEIVSCNITQVEQIEHATNEMNTSNKSLSFIDGKIKMMPATIHKNSNIISCDIPIDDKYIAIINKDDVVNMNLHIEIQNGETSHQNQSKHTEVQRTSSLLDLFKLKKSQSCSADGTITQTRSLQSIITRINNNYANVIVRCGCCGKNTAIPCVDAVPVYKDDNGFFILMPNTSQCRNRKENNGAIHTTKKTDAELSTRNLCHSNADAVYPCVTQNVGMVMTVLDPNSPQNDKYQSDDFDRAKTTSCISQDNYNVENYSIAPLQELEKSAYIVAKSKLQDLPLSVIDTYSQTEWSRIWLAVRRQKEGRYSFRLPPLSMLKEYKR